MHIFIEKTGPYDLSGLAYPAGKPTDLFTEYRPQKTEGGRDD
ncbi:hypothetical protein BN3659_02360 [Alistipes sp. CHKCI003]|nr:hypothetical protein BN3659_02360 [Alistipes sp. CHKCI003]